MSGAPVLTREKIEVEQACLARREALPNGTAGGREVLCGVSFSVMEREVFGIIGPSGSGKTSLLRLLNGLDDLTSGRILIDGENVSSCDIVALRRRVGMVFQSPALFPGTVADNVEYALGLLGMGPHERRRRGLTCLERVGLPSGFWERSAGELSQGEQQRVTIARAIAAEPEVLLMDEPTSALDPTSASRILSLVSSLNRDTGVTIVYVSHVMEHARRVCGRALLLVDGREVEQGEIGELLDSPKSELTRLFVEGRLEGGENGGADEQVGGAEHREGGGE